jgi:anti-sigma B factor antagonist
MSGHSRGPDGAELGERPVAGVDRVDATTIVRLQGELDLYNADKLREALLTCCAEQPDRLVIDLAGVKFVDSTALGVLVEASTRLADGKSLVLAAPGLETRRALEISGLDRHFAVHATVDDALAASP